MQALFRLSITLVRGPPPIVSDVPGLLLQGHTDAHQHT